MLFFKTAKITLQGFWEKITASDLGTGSSGTGTKVLHDDMTWKPVTSSGAGCNVLIDCGLITAPNENVLIDCGTIICP